jgi:hypothetical protein
MFAYSFSTDGYWNLHENFIRCSGPQCPTTQFLNLMDHRARALVMAGISLHTGALHIGMGP